MVALFVEKTQKRRIVIETQKQAKDTHIILSYAKNVKELEIVLPVVIANLLICDIKLTAT
jgi:hypothetical protein